MKAVEHGEKCHDDRAPGRFGPRRPERQARLTVRGNHVSVRVMAPRALARFLIVVPFVVPLAAQRVAFADDQQDFSKVAVKATKVAGQVYVVEDATPEFSGGN